MPRATNTKPAAASAAPSPILTGWIERDGAQLRASQDLLQAAANGWAADQAAKVAKVNRDAHSAILEAGCAGGDVIVVEGVVRTTITARSVTEIIDPDALRATLGERFDDLVESFITFRPREGLLEIARDGDDPLAPAARKCLKSKTITAVSYRAPKVGG